MTKIVFCQATFDQDLDDTKKCIERVSPHVDATVIAYDQSLSPSQVAELQAMGVVTVFFEWHDNMPLMRQAYLVTAKEIGADWICVSDPDELYSEELAKNLRRLIEASDAQGYNLLPVHCIDQFENVEFLDDLDKLKETPGGYRETDFWKPLLIFKVYPDTHYEGVGAKKNVHEMLKSSTEMKARNLPKEYPYVHHKSALRIWRNAARNMFIGGGGDNVGDLNPYWMQLRDICSDPSINIQTWPQFEEQVKKGFEELRPGQGDDRLKRWLFDALQAPPTNWGTEVRETSKWYYALHRDEVTPEVLERIKNPPKLTPDMEVENYVTRAYFEVLGRHPDEEGRKQYVQQILEGQIKREELTGILRQSPEFRQKFLRAPAGPTEFVRMQVPVNLDVQINEETFIEAMRRSELLWNVIKPKMDIGGWILDHLTTRKRREFAAWFYSKKDDITPQDLAYWLKENSPKPDSVALCIMGYSKGLPMILETINTVGPYVDEIHVLGDDFTKDNTDLMELMAFKASRKSVQVQIEPWRDEFSDYKNKVIEPANTEWVLILDHDEIPTPEMAASLREIIEKSKRGKNFNIISFDVIDIETVNDAPVSENRSTGGKPLLHWNVPEPYYGNPHIWLKPNYYGWQMFHAPLAYRHVKDREGILPNSVRNVFLGGGGDNTRDQNPAWVELRAITGELRLSTWKDLHAYLKKGKIDPRLLDVLKRLAEMPWKDSELQDPLRYYRQLHPEE
jgi:hypothetical protein